MALLNYLPATRQLASGLLLALSYMPTTKADNAADYFVSNLPGQPSEPAIKMHAGHIEVDTEHNGNLFFWHFQNQHMANRQRTVIWLNGGPGCSSEDGALMEIGPYRVRGDDLVYNNGSWNEYANLLFVDNPVGTGFSYVDTNSYLKELDNMADQFLSFMEQFFEIFPEYEDDDIYFAGESYAGQHIPYIAKHILERNKEAGGKKKWNLQGLLIGNGWIAPKEQYGAYLKFAYDKGLLQKGSPEAKQLEQQWRICKASLATDVRIDKSECEKILQDFLETTASLTLKGKRQCFNMYDVRLKDDYPSCGMKWPPDLEDMTPYLRKKEVVSALHINDAKSTGWKECNGAVGSHFTAHDSEPSVDLLPEILKEVPITLFSGAEDLICNHFGTEDFIANMQWNGGKGFGISGGEQAPRRAWTFEGEEAGYWQEARNLTYVLFHEASHMVPFDWPRRSRDMLDRVMGVDYAAVGHEPADSHIGDEVSSGNSTAPSGDDKQKEIDDAKWDAYYRSGSVVLVIVIIGAGAFGFYVWRDRRRRRGYQGLAGGESGHRGGPGGGGHGARGLERFREREGVGRDVEAGDFDESELDDLHVATPTEGRSKGPYAVGDDDDDDSDDDDVQKHKKNGGAAANGTQPLTG